MKKIIAMLLAALMLLTLAACGEKQIPEEELVPEERVTIANPVVEASADEILEKVGLTMNIPAEAENVSYAIVADEVAQCTFTVDGVDYTYRMKPTAEAEDINGMYFEWASSEETEISYCPAAVCWNDGAEGAVSWCDIVPGVSYGLSVNEKADRDMLVAMAEKLFAPLQGEAEGDADVLLGEDFTAILEKVSADLHPGTAGSSLIAAALCGELCDYCTANAPTAAAVLNTVKAFAAETEDPAMFRQQMSLVCGAFDSITGENAADMLETCGYTPVAEAWDAEALEPVFAGLTTALDAENAYEAVLSRYTTARSENWDGQKYVDEGMNYMAKDVGIGACVADLDGDGVYELLIGTTETDDFNNCLILDLYTLDENGEVKLVFQSAERSRYYYAGDNLFTYHGSGSAFDSVDTAYAYSAGEMQELEQSVDEFALVQPEYTVCLPLEAAAKG